MRPSKYWLLLLLLALVVACERDDSPPPVTIGSAATSAPPPENQAEPVLDPDEEIPAIATAELAEGTPEQQARLMQARTAFLADEYEVAEAIFSELALETPATGATVSAGIALGQIYLETGRPDEALRFLDALRPAVEDLPEVLLVIARVYAALDRPADALRTYDEAFAQQQDYIFILPEMAELLVAAGEEDTAAQILTHYEERLRGMVAQLTAVEQTADNVRVYIVDLLSMLHDELAHQALIAALEDPNAQVRGDAARALGNLAVTEAEDALRRSAVEDESDAVRLAARQALEEIR